MSTTIAELEAWMQVDSEDEHLEFKEGKASYEFEKLVKYCVALANEGGGKFVLGVTDRQPRRVVGTQAFKPIARTKSGLYQRLHLDIEPEEISHPDGRVLVFHVPPRPRGVAVDDKGAYWMRIGDELKPMKSDQLRRIHEENILDFSAELCPGADMTCLDPEAIRIFRQRWIEKSGNQRLAQLSDMELLAAADLVVDGQLTNAALILMGTRSALRRYQLGQAEVVFEYRFDPGATRYDARENFQDGFLICADSVWETINLRNEVHQIPEGLFRRDIRSFQDPVIREGLLNAVSHRDYRLTGSVFVRQSPRRLQIESPGGFPPGVTPENVLQRHAPRNRLIAETFERCGYVERSGQGVRLMFEECIRDAKLPPDYAGSDDHHVCLSLWGEVQDDSFVRFLERVGQETQVTFGIEDYLILDRIRRNLPIPGALRPRLPHLRDLGIIEVTGRGRGTRYILSRQYYDFVGRRGVYTRTRGLDRHTNKELLIKHIADIGDEGSRLRDLRDVLPALTVSQVRHLLAELRREQRVHVVGKTRSARWYPGPAPD